MSNYSFQTIVSRKIKGYTQAVSDDGSIMITRTKGFYYAYYYDGEKIIEIQFVYGLYVVEVPTNYEEQSANYFGIKTRIEEDKIAIYFLSEDRQSIYRFQCEKIEGGDCTRKVSGTTQPVQSMWLHPLHDSLIVTFSENIKILLVDGENSTTVNLYESNVIIESSFIYPIVTNSQLALYCFFVITQNDKKKIRARKITQDTYLQQYRPFILPEKEIENNSSSYLDRVQFDDQKRIFGASLTYGFDEWGHWDGVTFFIEEGGSASLDFTDLELYNWGGFISGQNKVTTIKHIGVETRDNTIHLVDKVCTMEYKASSLLITFLDSTEKCPDGSYEYYDRIAVWQMNHTNHIITQHEQAITVWDDEFNLVQELSGYTFSTKMDDVLIVNTFDELHYMQYKEVESEESVVPEECETEVGMIVGLICLSVLIVVLIGLLVHTCARITKRKKSERNSSQENILTKRDPGAFHPQIGNPYAQDSSLPMATNTKKHP